MINESDSDFVITRQYDYKPQLHSVLLPLLIILINYLVILAFELSETVYCCCCIFFVVVSVVVAGSATPVLLLLLLLCMWLL